MRGQGPPQVAGGMAAPGARDTHRGSHMLGISRGTGARMRATALTAALLGAGALFGAEESAAQPRPVPTTVTTIDVPGVGPMTVLTYQARFVSADPADRRVVLEGANGKRWSVLVPPLFGDVMAMANSRSVTVRVLPGTVTYLGKAHQGTPGRVSAEVVLKDGLPGWPQDFGFREVTVTNILVNIDKANGTISFEGPEGLVRTVKAANAQVLADLQQVQLGDLCEIRYYEGLTVTANY